MILYSTGCSKCKVLKEKLDQLHIEYTVCDDTDIMFAKGFLSVPMLEVDDKIMTFNEAIKWLKEKTNE